MKHEVILRFRAHSRMAVRPARRGSAAKEVVLTTFVLTCIGMTLYFLGQRGVVRLTHYVCTMTGSPYQ